MTSQSQTRAGSCNILDAWDWVGFTKSSPSQSELFNFHPVGSKNFFVLSKKICLRAGWDTHLLQVKSVLMPGWVDSGHRPFQS